VKDLGLSFENLQEQIKMHEIDALKCEQLCIVNTSPKTIDDRLRGEMISISYARDYDSNFTKKLFPGGVYMFDIGKIRSVKPDSKPDGLHELEVVYDGYSGATQVKLHLNDYASDSVTIPEKQHTWRLLTSLGV
jgi:hypothetical protein